MTGTDRGTEESRKVPLKKRVFFIVTSEDGERRKKAEGKRGEGKKASKTLNEAHNTLFVRVPRNETK